MLFFLFSFEIFTEITLNNRSCNSKNTKYHHFIIYLNIRLLAIVLLGRISLALNIFYNFFLWFFGRNTSHNILVLCMFIYILRLLWWVFLQLLLRSTRRFLRAFLSLLFLLWNCWCHAFTLLFHFLNEHFNHLFLVLNSLSLITLIIQLARIVNILTYVRVDYFIRVLFTVTLSLYSGSSTWDFLRTIFELNFTLALMMCLLHIQVIFVDCLKMRMRLFLLLSLFFTVFV